VLNKASRHVGVDVRRLGETGARGSSKCQRDVGTFIVFATLQLLRVFSVSLLSVIATFVAAISACACACAGASTSVINYTCAHSSGFTMPN
jgi:hypothetical protein